MKLQKMKFLNFAKLVCFILLLTQVHVIKAQNSVKKNEIIGTVTNEDGIPLANISIMLKNTSYGTSTNRKGEFSLYVPVGSYTLVTSSLTHKKAEQNITLEADNALTIELKLIESSEVLNEVIVEGSVNKEHIILESKTATKSNISLMNTPAPIVVVSGALLEQQANSTIQESIRNISGVTQAGNNYGIGDNLIIRGLSANYAYDGMYGGGSLGNTFNPVRSQTNIEKIEVLKGPSAGLYGMGAAGGVINLIEKKPLDFEQYVIETRIGQWDHYRAMVDLTGPLSDKISYRFVSASERENGYRDVSTERYETYGALSYKTDKHQFTLSSAYIEDAIQIDATGNPVRLITTDLLGDPNDGGYDWENLVNDTAVDSNGDFIGEQLTDEQRQELANSLLNTDGYEPFDIGGATLVSPLATPNQGAEFRIKLRHDWQPSETFTITNQFLYRKYNSDYVRQTGALNYSYYQNSGIIHDGARSPLIIDDVIYPYAARRQEYRIVDAQEKMFQYFGDFQKTWGADNAVRGEHLLSINYENRNIDYSQHSTWDADDSRATTPVPYILDIRNPNWGTGDIWDYDPILRSQYEKTVQGYGVGFQEVVYYNKFTARIGGAYLGTKQSYQNLYDDGQLIDFDDSGFAYNLGLNYRAMDQLSVYGNYSVGRTVYSVTSSLDGDDRPDSESESIDFGLRYKSTDNNLLASLVFFQTATTNLQYTNDDYDDDPDSSSYNVDVVQYFYDQENRTKGIELDVNYSLTNFLSFNANATFQDPKTLEGEEVTTEQTKGVPKTYARFWSQYKHLLGKAKNPLSFNFGVSYESERTIDGYSLTGAHVDSYVLFDTALGYGIGKNWDLRLNIDNLFNTRYYVKAMFAGALPGETRNYQLTARYTF
ncbi:TonB-dependent receptor [Cellulophaga baltica]|uniref:TonB-dependent receptor n=1 Tax=Cellulophaga TaxID=104264 RepID=UPI001C07E688|nr:MULTISPECIES: TonB-dependent receptor [Cellulophaga]MBU2997384.1 TonB-dependent receptor [Cellulophaga baltica]MDO6768781.1 TonB-dependent receptor [Cellulophaga sp. 1_MG-2023]